MATGEGISMCKNAINRWAVKKASCDAQENLEPSYVYVYESFTKDRIATSLTMSMLDARQDRANDGTILAFEQIGNAHAKSQHQSSSDDPGPLRPSKVWGTHVVCTVEKHLH